MKNQGKRLEGGLDLVTASEIASFVYCAEQRRLQSGLRMDPANRTSLDGGTRDHERKAVAERAAGGFSTSGGR